MTDREKLEAEKVRLGNAYGRVKAEWDRITGELARVAGEQRHVIDALAEYDRTGGT